MKKLSQVAGSGSTRSPGRCSAVNSTGKVSLLAVLCAAAAVSLHPAAVYGEGFRNPPAGSFDLGRAGGRIAQVDDNSAIANNPANLVDVTNTQVNFTPTIISIEVDYTNPQGGSDKTKHPWKVLPNFFVSKPICDDRFSIGLGITVPYGIDNQWSGGTVTASAAPYYSDLTTINFNPTFSARLTDTLQLGVGADVMWSHIRFNQFLTSPFVPGRLAELEVAGTGVGVGGNVGLTWKPTERQSIAVTYRSPMTVEYSGEENVTSSSAFVNNYTGDFSSRIKFPTIASLGYGFKISDTVRVESDLEWLQFSRFQNLPVTLSSASPVPSQNVNEHWHDTFTVGVGGDWAATTNLTLRAGYQFYESPVPENTYSPSIPDADQNVFTVGISYVFGHHGLEAAYGLDFYNTRHIANDQVAAYNGTYIAHVHLFSLSYRYSF